MHRIRVALDQLTHCGDLLRNPHVDEPDDALMWQPADKDQFAKVFIFGDQYPLLFIRQREQGFIRGAWVSVQG